MSKAVIDKLKEWGVTCFVFFVPVFFIVNRLDLRVEQEKFYQVMCMVFTSLFVGNIWITLFILWNILLYVYGGYSVGSMQIVNCFLFGITFASARNLFSNKSLSLIWGPLKLLTAITIFYMIFQVFGIGPLDVYLDSKGVMQENSTCNQLSGLMHLPAINGTFLALVAPIFLFTTPIIGLLMAIPILTCHSSGAILAYFALVVFWAWKKSPKKIFAIFAVISAIAFSAATYMDFKDDKLTYKSRFENWHLVLKLAWVNPIGYGPDSFRNYNKIKNFVFFSDEDYNPGVVFAPARDGELARFRYYSPDNGKWLERFGGRVPKHFSGWNEAHNEYLELWFQYGLIGLLLMFLFVREVRERYVLSDKSRDVLIITGMFIVLAVSSITQFPFHLARIVGILGIVCGAFWALTDKNYNQYKGTA